MSPSLDDTQQLPIIDPDPPGGDPYNYVGSQVIWDVMTKSCENHRWKNIMKRRRHLYESRNDDARALSA